MSDETLAMLMKWPSINSQRVSQKDGAAPYTIMRGALRDCVVALRSKPEFTHHLYEVRLADGSILSAIEALALFPKNNDHPPPEEDYGGGDFVSVQREPSTDDDQPLE